LGATMAPGGCWSCRARPSARTVSPAGCGRVVDRRDRVAGAAHPRVGDVAKMLGYPAGWLWRVRNPAGLARHCAGYRGASVEGDKSSAFMTVLITAAYVSRPSGHRPRWCRVARAWR
jgi:hypothetical protein